jgi:hypothetical protein
MAFLEKLFVVWTCNLRNYFSSRVVLEICRYTEPKFIFVSKFHTGTYQYILYPFIVFHFLWQACILVSLLRSRTTSAFLNFHFEHWSWRNKKKWIRVLIATSIKRGIFFSGLATFSLAETDRRFRGRPLSTAIIITLTLWGSKHLRNVGRFLQDYKRKIPEDSHLQIKSCPPTCGTW